jgi:hypothetical protein
MNFNFKNIHESKTVRGILIGIIIAIILLVVFTAGVSIGEHKARFAGQFGDNFERNFMDPRGGMMGDMMRGVGGHGAIGEIISIKLPQIIVSGPDNLEKTILVSTSTTIRRFQETIQSSELKTGDFVVTIGTPNQSGQIEAKLIRIMPAK